MLGSCSSASCIQRDGDLGGEQFLCVEREDGQAQPKPLECQRRELDHLDSGF